MLHRSIETTTVAIPIRRAGPRYSSEVRRNRGKRRNCALHHFFLELSAVSNYVPIVQCSNRAGWNFPRPGSGAESGPFPL